MITPNELDQIEDKAPEMEPFWLRAAVVRLVAEVRQMRAVAELADQINARKCRMRDWPDPPDEVTEAEMRAAESHDAPDADWTEDAFERMVRDR